MIFDQIKNVHFVGIGGIGMSGIAELLATAGITVTGCDLKRSAATELLRRRGITIHIGHDPEHLHGADLVVVTAAVKGRNAELEAALTRGIRVVRRAEMLGEIVARHRAIGVAGTHGKTTTTAMVAMILEEAGLDPTVLVGGMLRNLGTNAKSGKSEFLVVEADEYDRTFHHLHPEVAVITNIEADHLEYYGSFDAIVEAFRLFVEGLRPGALVVACVDDPVVDTLIRQTRTTSGGKPFVGYGLGERADLRAQRLEFSERGATFEVDGLGSFQLLVPGEHNVRNALGAIAVARHLEIPAATIAAALSKFLGVDRRFQILGDYAGAVIVDDYAHHPTEIRATLDAARRGYPGRRIIALFQPHLYSRTRDFSGDFAAALRVADIALVAPIYAAREQPIEGISAGLIAAAEKGIEFLDRSHDEIVNEIRRRLQPNDVFITMGAGDVHEIAEALVRGDAA